MDDDHLYTTDNYFKEFQKIMDYFLAMIRSYYPEYKPGLEDLQFWREGIYEMLLIDNRKYEEVHEVIDFISMTPFWRENITNLKQVRNKFQEIMRDKKSREARKKKELTPKDNQAEERLKKIFNEKEKKERSKERKDPL